MGNQPASNMGRFSHLSPEDTGWWFQTVSKPFQSLFSTTMWGPPVISWFINPINYSYKYINHGYWSYKPT